MSVDEDAVSAAAGASGGAAAVREVNDFAARLLSEQPFRNYELGECLEATDRSAVFKAQDKTMQRTVAVKAMQPSPERTGAVEEFFSQAGSVARVRHPALARGLDAGRGGGVFFMAHELAKGESLAAKLARRQIGRLTEKESLALVREVAALLQELFEIGQPYGDLRPTRMLVGDGGRIKLLGIGFNWTLVWPDDRQAFLTKPDYLSPERIADELNIDIRGDLYSLGCIWHKVLLGEPVFKGVTPEQTLEMHLSAKATPPRETDPRLSASTSQLLLWLLEKNRDARPRTPREFLKRLAAHPLLETEQPAAVQAGGAEDAGAGSDLDRDDLSE